MIEGNESYKIWSRKIPVVKKLEIGKLENCFPWLDEFALRGMNPTSIAFGKAEHVELIQKQTQLKLLKN